MPQRKWASSRLEGRTSWMISSCDRCSQLMTGTSGTRSGGLRKGQSPCELLGGLLGFLSRRCRGLRPCVPEPEDYSPVLTWNLGYFRSPPRGVSLFKSRDIALPTNVCLVKAMVFPVVMYECESWTVKKAERRRIDAFELWCWGRLLRVPWTARRSN